jgi:hypothetical protein
MGLTKIVAVVVGAGVGATFNQPLNIFLGAARFSVWQTWPLGWTVVGVLAVLYAVFKAGDAWVRSRGPVLFATCELIEDLDHQMFRLLVSNHGEGELTPQATMRWVTVDGQPRFRGAGPFPLEWLHLEGAERPRLSHNEEITLAIAYMSGREIAFAGAFRYRPRILDNEVRTTVRFCFRIIVPGSKQYVERVFGLYPDPARPLRYRWVHDSPRSRWRALLRRSFPSKAEENRHGQTR